MVVLPDRTVVPPAVSNEWHRRGRSTVFYREHQLSFCSVACAGSLDQIENSATYRPVESD